MAKYQNPHIEEVYVIRWDASSKVPPRRDEARGAAGFFSGRGLVLGFVLLAAVLSTVILGFRNLYDDEIFSLPFVTRSVPGILDVAREGDVHPPGMYLLAHAAWRLLPSYRWLNLLPEAVLFAGLAVFLVRFMPRFRGRAALVCAVLFGALHPELLMWSNTLRWYCPWTGLALLALVIFLEPEEPRWRLGWMRGSVGVALLGAMFYLNYITLLFMAALVPALWVRLRAEHGRDAWRKLMGCGVGFLLLILPQLRTMITVHLPNSGAQRSNIVVSAARLGQAITGSEAFVPWSVLAMAATAVSLWVLGAGLWSVLRRLGADDDEAGSSGASAYEALAVFGISFLLLVIVSGLGGKPRNAMLLVPAFAPAVGSGVERLGRRAQWVCMCVFAAWCGWGAAHLVGRFGLQKSNMNDRPEQVARLIVQDEAAMGSASGTEGCALAVTYDSGLALVLAQEHVPRLMILSPFRGEMFAGTLDDLPSGCERVRLYVVQSYISGEPERDRKYIHELDSAKNFFRETPAIAKLSRDPDAAMKRRLSRVMRLDAGITLPDYRFVVFFGAMDRARLPELRRTLRYFVSGEGVVPDGPEDGQPGGST